MKYIKYIFILALMAAMPSAIKAFDLGVYAPKSVLSEGRWGKVSVEDSGVYLITPQIAKSLGFSSIDNLYIYGYGGNIPVDILTEADYIDDLPVVPFERTPKGLVFYAEGPHQWNLIDNDHAVRSSSPYSTKTFYYISDVAPAELKEIQKCGTEGANEPVSTFLDRLHHETDLVSPGETGPLLVGEDFKYTNQRNFNFTLTDRVKDTDIWFETSFVAKTYNNGSNLSFKATADGSVDIESNSSDNIPATSNSSYYHGKEAKARHSFNIADNGSLVLTVKHTSGVTVQGAWLNYISLMYTRSLAMNSNSPLNFWLNNTQAALSGATSSTRIWDVTEPMEVKALNYRLDGSTASFTNDYTGMRSYVAWDDNSEIPSPKVEGNVSNQNLHGLETYPDMVIVTRPEWKLYAKKLADYHRRDEDNPLTTLVVTPDEVYNEFSSGMPTPHGLRAFFKMLYDRGLCAEKPFKYVTLMGRASYDFRGLSNGAAALAKVAIPTYLSGNSTASLCDNDSFGCDDFFAMLEDEGYTYPGLDQLVIGVGRIPVTTVSDAQSAVDKIIDYGENAKKTGWKNQIIALADDGDSGIHLQQMESLVEGVVSSENNPFVINKVYVDAYTLTNGEAVEARQEMYRLLDEGMAWWWYVGHASTTGWTEEGILKYTDINSLYLRKIPMLYAATCDFLRWDASDISGGEILFENRNGGIIGAISATRPVYIADNGLLSAAFGRSLAQRGENGKLKTIGDVYKDAKNDIRSASTGNRTSNTNRLRYVLMGDPALKVCTPSNMVTLDAVDGVEVNEENQVTVAALQNAVFTGSIYSPTGELLTDFDGVVDMTIFDAESSVTTLDHAGDGIQRTFEKHGDRIYAGSGQVKNGKYSVNVAMPGEIANNFRPATVSLYARSTAYGDIREAISHNNEIYVYGYDDTVPEDTTAPIIEKMYMNSESFVEGSVVDRSPMFYAYVRDDVGINMSSAGIGHQMQIILDGKTYNDVANYYTPASDGSASGVIAYPFQDLDVGAHEIRLRVWDTSANSVIGDLSFMCANRLAPNIVNVYTDASPAHDTAGFYVVTDRLDTMAKVTVTVYDIMGRTVWGGSVEGRNDNGVSVPLYWDLNDSAGRRVPKGIYIYKATVTTDGGQTYTSASQKIAVAGN